MITRMALIIGAPDEKIPGVKLDVENLSKFLKSPIGGFWHDSEIKTLISPNESEIDKEINMLKCRDYSLIFFAGHGYYSNPNSETIIHINSMTKISSNKLRVGAKKHLLILDCCRKREDDMLSLVTESALKAFDSAIGQRANPEECRHYFNKKISDCDNGLVVMNSCSVDETAGESESKGGYYTYSLINSAKDWARAMLNSIDVSRKYATHSTQECHEEAKEKVFILSGGRQTPEFESPRTEKKFPFVIVA